MLKTAPAADQSVETMLTKEKANVGTLLVGLFPGAGNESRRWPLSHFAEVADHLIRNEGVRVIVFAGPEERPLIPDMRILFPEKTIFLDRLTIPQLVSAQARLTLFISNDTGPAHTAAAVGTPVVFIMDRPTPNSFTPVGDQHRLIGAEVIHQVSVQQVYQAVREILASSRTDKLRSL
jgi:ADP-heptose:LPS heptosyltransferase